MHSSVDATHWNIISVLLGRSIDDCQSRGWTGWTKPFAPWMGTYMFEPVWPQRTVQGRKCKRSVKITALSLTLFSVKQSLSFNKLQFCITFHHALIKYALVYAQTYKFRQKQDFSSCYERTSTKLMLIYSKDHSWVWKYICFLIFNHLEGSEAEKFVCWLWTPCFILSEKITWNIFPSNKYIVRICRLVLADVYVYLC
jgi:hypothetical protein